MNGFICNAETVLDDEKITNLFEGLDFYESDKVNESDEVTLW
jgi:hypothetical protein